MEDNLKKYASILLDTCLKIEDNQALFISYNKEVDYFVKEVVNVAKDKNIKDIYLDEVDVDLKHDLLKNKSVEELEKHPLWNNNKWNEYAKKDAAFLMIASINPGLMDDIDVDKISAMNKYVLSTRKDFDEARDKSRLAWCIACAPTIRWAKDIFKESSDPVNDLWDAIFDICLIKKKYPERLWQKKIDNNSIIAKMLTDYQFKKLKYKSSNGTDFVIGLPNNHV